MSNARNVLSSLSHRLGATGSARVRVFDGSGAPSPRRVPFVLSALAVCLGVLALTAAPALAAAPEPEEPKTIEPATSITGTSAVFEGVLNPHSEALVGGYFVYSEPNGITCVEGPTAGLEGFEGEQDVKAQAVHVTVGLQPGRKYKFCLVAYNEAGAQLKLGNEVSVETPALAPTIDSESVSATNSTAATLEAQVNANNQETSFSFEYSTEGTTGAGGKLEGTITTVTGKTPLPAVYGDQAATVPKLEGLTPGTDYYYRVAAKDATGTETGAVELFTTVPAPTTDPTSLIAATTATLNGHFALNETTPTRYSFTYSKGAVCSGENPVTTPSVEAGTGKGTPVAASAAISELIPDSEYTACLTTSNQYGSETGAPVHFTTLIRESVIEVTATNGELQAEINPDGAKTTYHFEYGATTGYGHSTPEATLFGEDDSPHTGSAAVQELTPATEYHYRVIATNTTTHATTTGPDQTFTTQATGGEFKLPDNRAWEMVSPPNKHGATIKPQNELGGLAQAAENGSAMTYVANAPIAANPEGNVSVQYSQVVSTRGSSGGWASREVTTHYAEPLSSPSGGPEYLAFSPTLSNGVIERLHNEFDKEIPLSPLASEATIYLREALTTPEATNYVPLVNDENVAPGTHYGNERGHEFRGASTNLEHIVFNGGKLTSSGGDGLYEWTAGTLQYIGEGELGDSNENVRGAVSEDGQHVFFDSVEGGDPGHLYARLVSEERTVQLDLVQGGSGSGEPGILRYQYATPDGMKVYFTDDQRLTANSTAERERPELYEYDFVKPAGHELTDLTPDPGGASTDVKGETEISENGEYVYFYANGALDGSDAGECSGESAAAVCNLYVARVAGGTVSTSRIATLSDYDQPDWTAGAGPVANLPQMPHIASGASPNGRYFAFMSSRSLTGYDNRDAVTGERDEEVFLYDAAADRLTCASCDPTGARPHGTFDTNKKGEVGGQLPLVDQPGTWQQGRASVDASLAGLLPGSTGWARGRALYRPRYLTNEGRLFFDSADSLVPQDTNGKFDVYEFASEGLDCGSGSTSGSEVFESARRVEVEGRAVEGVAGCVALISSGESSEESAFLDASGKGPGGQEGEDVFFLTGARLSPQDVDTSPDVYDAHVCSAVSPCPAGVAVSPPCSTADSCRVAPGAQPSSFGAPPSATYSGPGDLLPAAQGVSVPKSLTHSERLAAALRQCRRDRNRHKRASCEVRARRKYSGAKRAARQRRSVNNNRRAGR